MSAVEQTEKIGMGEGEIGLCTSGFIPLRFLLENYAKKPLTVQTVSL